MIIKWLGDSAIITQDITKGTIETNNVIFRPKRSVKGADIKQPIGVLALCTLETQDASSKSIYKVSHLGAPIRFLLLLSGGSWLDRLDDKFNKCSDTFGTTSCGNKIDENPIGIPQAAEANQIAAVRMIWKRQRTRLFNIPKLNCLMLLETTRKKIRKSLGCAYQTNLVPIDIDL